MPQEIIFLLILLLLGIVSKNQTLVIAVAVLLAIRLFGLGSRLFPSLDKYGIKIGIIFIMVSVLAPIATGEIKLVDLYESMKSSYGIISILAGVLVAILGSFGVQLLDKSPQVTFAIVLGVILSVVFFKGIPVGPLIGAGIAMALMKAFDIIKTFLA